MKLTRVLLEQELECIDFETFAEANTYMDSTYSSIGNGDNGYAYKTHTNTVIKVTKDLEELEISKRIKGKVATIHFVKIFKICEYGFFAIIEKEYAQPVPDEAPEGFLEAAEHEIGTEIDPSTKGNLGVVDGELKFFDY